MKKEERTDEPLELERLAEENGIAYEDNLALRVLVSIIPGIGGSLDMVLADGGRRYRERVFRALEDMSVDMKERLETMEESALEYLLSPQSSPLEKIILQRNISTL